MQEYVQIISTVGFPIFMCLFLFKYMNDEKEKHREEVDKLTETINSNTQVLTELCTLIKTLVK